MATEDNKAIVRRYFDALTGLHFERLDSLLAPDFVCHFNSSPPKNAEAFKELLLEQMRGFSRLIRIVAEQIAEGNKIATRTTIYGIHTGKYRGIPPTGKQIAISAINIHRLQDGLIAEQWISFDELSLLHQIGALPAADKTEPPFDSEVAQTAVPEN